MTTLREADFDPESGEIMKVKPKPAISNVLGSNTELVVNGQVVPQEDNVVGNPDSLADDGAVVDAVEPGAGTFMVPGSRTVN